MRRESEIKRKKTHTLTIWLERPECNSGRFWGSSPVAPAINKKPAFGGRLFYIGSKTDSEGFSGDLRFLLIEEDRVFAVDHNLFTNNALPDIGLRRNFIHHIEHDILQNGSKTPGP